MRLTSRMTKLVVNNLDQQFGEQCEIVTREIPSFRADAWSARVENVSRQTQCTI